MTKNSYVSTPEFITKDGSTIRELMHPLQHGNLQQSLAEATVPSGTTTVLHKHLETEEIYYILSGQGSMTLHEDVFKVVQGDVICIKPDSPHKIQNTGTVDLVFLCCCSPAYSDQDTVLL